MGYSPAPGKQLVARQNPPNAVRRVESNPLLMSADHWTRLKEISESAVKSGLLPRSIDTPQKAFVIAIKGNELGFSPMYALERISVVNGKATIDGQGMLRLIYERCPGARVEFSTPVDKQAIEAEVMMARPGGKGQIFKFTIQDAQKANLTSKESWKNYPRAMLRWRVIAEGARIVFPDIIAGLYLHEEMGKTVNEEGEIIEAEYKVTENKPQEIQPEAKAAEEGKQEEQEVAAMGIQEPGIGHITEKQVARLHAIRQECGWGHGDVKILAKEMFNVDSSKNLKQYEYEKLVNHIQANPKEAQPEREPGADG